ncbi:hypothetical protein [Pricia sp.]|uniref:hypothetical protein n=1 Tax=Pricia sp. TaxID=2268138 RepID=UPI003593AE8C
MKKLVLTAVFALGSMTAFAQVEEEPQTQEDPQQQNQVDRQQQTQDATQNAEEKMEKSKDKMNKSKDKMAKKKDKEMEKAQNGFKEVSMDELPEAINTAIQDNYPNATVDKAMVNKKMQYKLEATMEDGSTETMMMDEEGNPIQDNR